VLRLIGALLFGCLVRLGLIEREDEQDVFAGHDVLRGAQRFRRVLVPIAATLVRLLITLLVALLVVVVFRALVVLVAVVILLFGLGLVAFGFFGFFRGVPRFGGFVGLFGLGLAPTAGGENDRNTGTSDDG